MSKRNSPKPAVKHKKFSSLSKKTQDSIIKGCEQAKQGLIK